MKWGELMKCPKCGKENNAENARCFFCNNQLFYVALDCVHNGLEKLNYSPADPRRPHMR